MRTVLFSSVTFLGIGCNLLGSVPQALRTVWRRRTEGLAATGLWLSVVANVLWLGYGAAAGDESLLLLNAVTTTLSVTVLVSFVRHSPARPAAALHAAGAAGVGVLALLAATGHPAALSAAGAALGFVTGAPQLLALLRGRGSAGVAVGGYLISLVGAAAWTARWGLAGHPAVALSSAYGLLVNAAGLALLRHRPALARAGRGMATALPSPVGAPLRLLRGVPLTE